MSNYERINLDEYVRSGEGGTAVSYTHKTRPTLAKLYNPGFEVERAESEFRIARTVFELGVSTPEPYRLVTDGERYGAEYELIPNKRSFTRIISEEPHRLEEISLDFAAQARKLHDTPADTTRLRSYKQSIKRFYEQKDLVTPEFKAAALEFLEGVEDTPRCVHGDLHIGNIITDGKRTLWIDIGEFGYGAPQWDLSLLWSMTHRMRTEMAMDLFHVDIPTLTAHWDIFLPAYLGTSDPQALGSFVKGLLPYYAVKVPYVYDMAYHCAMPKEGLNMLIGMFHQ